MTRHLDPPRLRLRRRAALGLGPLVAGLGLLPAAGASATARPGGSDHNIVCNVLTRWRVPGTTDAGTVTTAAAPAWGHTDGQLFYVPGFPAPGRHTLARLVRPAPPDSADSIAPGELPGYAPHAPAVLGHPFRERQEGTAPLWRWYGERAGDRLTAFHVEGQAETPPGYVRETSLGYGYPRYGNVGEKLVWVEGREMNMAANLVTGAAVWRLNWGGKQFVNAYDFGRQIQIALNLRPTTGPGTETDNPTEAGDRYGWAKVKVAGDVYNSPAPHRAHGAPVISHARDDRDPATGRFRTLRTVTRPLQFVPDARVNNVPLFPGGGPDNPVVWLGTFGKTVTVDDPVTNVVRWRTTVTMPAASNYADVQVVSAFLTKEFDQFYAYQPDPGRGRRWVYLGDRIRPPANPTRTLDPDDRRFPELRWGPGGVLIATRGGTHALGCYKPRAYPALGFGLHWADHGNGGGTYGPDTTMWTVLDRPAGGLAAGPHEYEVFLVVGSFRGVIDRMNWLFDHGY
jgi:hypothetical protein